MIRPNTSTAGDATVPKIPLGENYTNSDYHSIYTSLNEAVPAFPNAALTNTSNN